MRGITSKIVRPRVRETASEETTSDKEATNNALHRERESESELKRDNE